MIAFAIWLWLPLSSALSVAKAPRPFSEVADNGTEGLYPVWSFATEPELTVAPKINWASWSPRCEDGRYTFITPRGNSVANPGPMILNGNGDLIWFQYFDNDFGGQAYDLKVQQYQGQDYLTFWLGDDLVSGHGAGLYYMLDSSYEIVHRVGAHGEFEADLHEFLITSEGTALLTVYHKVERNLTAYLPADIEDDEPRGWVWDCLVQEIDIKTGELIFQWRALDHLKLEDTYRDVYDREGIFDIPWDWFHINSIAKDELGNFLISARYTHCIIYIDGKTGQMLWNLGGKHNSFTDIGSEPGLSFAKQHDARFHALDAFPEIYTPQAQQEGVTQRLMTFFDNTFGDGISRGYLVELTYPARAIHNGTGPDPAFTVRVLRTYDNPAGVRSISQGSMQVIPGHRAKVLIGYGHDPVWTEFDIDGTVLCDVHFAAKTTWRDGVVQSYRTLKYNWVGLPKTKPKLAINETSHEVFVSWNGATEIAEWCIQGSNQREADDRQWSDVVHTQKYGFESVTSLWTWKRYVRAVALMANGTVLGTSEVIDRGEEYPVPIFDLGIFTSIRVVGAMIGAIAAVFVVVYVSKKLRGWCLGHSRPGPYRWNQGSLYRRLSGEAWKG